MIEVGVENGTEGVRSRGAGARVGDHVAGSRLGAVGIALIRRRETMARRESDQRLDEVEIAGIHRCHLLPQGQVLQTIS